MNVVIQPEAINHIGIAVRSIEDQRTFYEDVLGARFEGIEEVIDQQVRIAFFSIGPPGSTVHLELLEPTSAESPLASHIQTRGEGLHHVAYTVSNIQERLDALKEQGIRLIDEHPRPGARQTRIAFLHPRSSAGVLTELCEPPDRSG